MVSRVTLLVLLLTLLCIQSQGTGRYLEVTRASSFFVRSIVTAAANGGNGPFFGGGGRFDIYGHPNVTGHEVVTTAVWIVGERDDRTLDAIQAGWHVNPALYGDSKTRFFTAWMAADVTGCYNTACEGFVKSDTAPISPGDVLPISTPDEIHELMIWIEKDDKGGDWWLYASTESTTSGKVGYWPKSLFSKLAQNATVVNYGGFVQVKKGSVSPPMGSGHFPNDTAAFFSNVEYVDEFGRKIAGNLPSVVTNKNCYDVGNMGDATFFYGGPGGCVN
ncbi:hypothetical protein LUZ62_014680 [Rhynchospora pubera]|uniref:Neprosin PEP catalytic domain-containing protein n=1 Tax=Rhynchospora pubera TaxID=906938 RepID=A0AAV8G8V3_9POAL|nr:hypothetical protein LUZ62_014680 [Rhynchospora pubera]